MAERTELALQKQLKRELQHRAWLDKNLPKTQQQRQSQRRVLVIRSALALKVGRAVEQ
ncbi:MAG: hypothetical protein JJ868_19830 [Shimia sp.]|jgi:hypothetical protein|uniref:hypothetical protein n=1 Tax=Shimia sp. TaxID=1954381 RepID=UPI001B1E095C|nr:hypothetical protein [Shimia sp.]MBO6899613.1 hypothetical protein [Shimia sp.]